MSDTPDNDLTLVSTQELIEELQRRNEATLIVREFSRNDIMETVFDHSGSLSACIGMAVRAQTDLLRVSQQGITGE